MPQSRKTKKHINKKYRKSNRKRKTYKRTYKRKRTRRSANRTRRYKRKSIRGGMEGGAAGGSADEKASILEQGEVELIDWIDQSKRLPLTDPFLASTECAKLFKEFLILSVFSHYNSTSQRAIISWEDKKLRNTLVDESKEIYIAFLLRSMPVVHAIPATASLDDVRLAAQAQAAAQAQLAAGATTTAPVSDVLPSVSHSDIEMELRAMSPRVLYSRAMAEGMTEEDARAAAELVDGKVKILHSSSDETLYNFTDQPEPVHRFQGNIAMFKAHMQQERENCNGVISSLTRLTDMVEPVIPSKLEDITFDDGYPLDLLSLVKGESQLRFMARNGDTMELKFTELHQARGFRSFFVEANDSIVSRIGEIDWRSFSLIGSRGNNYGVTLDPSAALHFAIDSFEGEEPLVARELNSKRQKEIIKLKKMLRPKLHKYAVKKGIVPKTVTVDALRETYNNTELIDLILKNQGLSPQIPRAAFDISYHADKKSPPVDLGNCKSVHQDVKIFRPMPSLYFHLKLQDIADPAKEYLFRIIYDVLQLGPHTTCPVLRVEMSLYTQPEMQLVGDCVKLKVLPIPGARLPYPILKDHKSFKQPTLSDYLRSGEYDFFNIVDFSTVMPTEHEKPLSGGAAGSRA